MRVLNKILILVFSLVSSIAVAAPAPGPPTTGSTPPCWPPANCVPIDKGVVFLIIAACLFFGKMLYDYSKKTKTANS